MTLAVIDASALTAFYVSDDSRRPDVVTRLTAGSALFAPAHLDIEVFSALRGLARGGKVVESVVAAALSHFVAFPIRRMPIDPLMERMWELRANVTGYDAAYIVLAERLDCVLITCDTKLAAATGPRCRIDVIG